MDHLTDRGTADVATRRWFVGAWWDALTLRVSRHRRVVVGVAVVALFVAALAFVNRDLNPEPTSATSPAMWRFQPMGGGPTISLQFDQGTGWTRLTDSRSPNEDLYFHDGRALLAANLKPLGIEGATFLSVPVETVFPGAMTFEPVQLAPSLDRGPKECTFPSSVENTYVQFFLASEIPELAATYTICGRSVFVNGSGAGVVYSEDLSIESLSHPPVEEVVEVESLGALGPSLLEQLKKEFDSRSGLAG